MIVLTLPYPISANRYWRPVHLGPRVSIVPTKEAKQYRLEVARLAGLRGVREPIRGRVEIGILLYPNQPQDWARREKKLGPAWDDGVLCLDLDNANKVLLDSIKGIVIEDDKWVRKLTSERMVPDGQARVEIFVRPLAVAAPADLFPEAA